MPTPFTHLAAADRLLADPALPPDLHALLHAEQSAFLLGNIAADARVSSGISRELTHFFRYDHPIVEHPWRVMLTRHPSLTAVEAAAGRAFLAGYVAHLTMDEVWAVEMVLPHFYRADWVSAEHRFLMLHIILCHMDARDYRLIPGWIGESLAAAQPDDWLPFMPDPDLSAWRDYIGGQLPPGDSQTLDIFGGRLGLPGSALADILASTEQMQTGLWDHVPLARLAQVEAAMYEAARTEMLTYLRA